MKHFSNMYYYIVIYNNENYSYRVSGKQIVEKLIDL